MRVRAIRQTLIGLPSRSVPHCESGCANLVRGRGWQRCMLQGLSSDQRFARNNLRETANTLVQIPCCSCAHADMVFFGQLMSWLKRRFVAWLDREVQPRQHLQHTERSSILIPGQNRVRGRLGVHFAGSNIWSILRSEMEPSSNNAKLMASQVNPTISPWKITLRNDLMRAGVIRLGENEWVIRCTVHFF